MIDFGFPLESVYLSEKSYIQGDCNKFRYKILIANFYREPMSNGDYITETYNDEWIYPDTYTVDETYLQMVCEKVK